MNDVKKGESSAAIRERVIKAREIQAERFRRMGHPELNTNSQLRGDMLEAAAALDGDASALLIGFAEKAGLSAGPITAPLLVSKERLQTCKIRRKFLKCT